VWREIGKLGKTASVGHFFIIQADKPSLEEWNLNCRFTFRFLFENVSLRGVLRQYKTTWSGDQLLLIDRNGCL
jgi:hypothetical protein